MEDGIEHSTDEPLKLRQFLTFRISQTQAKLSVQAATILKNAADLTLAQWRILALLGIFGRSRSTDLTRRTGIDKGLFSRKLKILTQRGLVKVETDDKDHRVHHLSLTPEGKALYERVQPTMKARQAALRAAIDDEEADVFLRVLDKLEHAAEQVEDF